MTVDQGCLTRSEGARLKGESGLTKPRKREEEERVGEEGDRAL